MKRPESHKTEERSKDILKGLLPEDWVLYDMKPDYAKDFMLEIGTGDKLVGLMCVVQLKGTKKLKYVRNKMQVAYDIEVEHLSYYEKMHIPVFAVVVDTVSRHGYWIFIQRLLDERADNWRKQKKVRILFPVQNEVSIHDGWKISKATQFMAAKGPEALQHALDRFRSRLKKLDPRFEICVTQGQTTTVQLIPGKDVTWSLEFDGDGIEGKMLDLVGKGKEVYFKKGEIKATGSPLIAALVNQDLLLKLESKHQAIVRLECFDKVGNLVSTLDHIHAVIAGGPLEVQLTVDNNHQPLTLHATLSPKSPVNNIQIGFYPERWHELHVDKLPYYNTYKPFIDSLDSLTSMKMTIVIYGEVLAELSVPQIELDHFRTFQSFYSLVEMLKTITAKFKINIGCPFQFKKEDIEAILVLNDLATKGENIVKLKHFSSDPEFHPHDKKLIERICKEREPGQFSLKPQPGAHFVLLGQKVDPGLHEITYTDVKIVNKDELLKQSNDPLSTTVRIHYAGTPSTQRIIRLIS